MRMSGAVAFERSGAGLRLAAALALVASMLASCSAAGDPVRKPPEGAGLAGDVRTLGRFFESSHADLDALVPPQEWAREVDDLAARIGGLGPNEALVELMRLATLPGRTGGGDGHTGVFPLDDHARPMHLLPLRLYEFPDGFYVVDAGPEHEDLVGAELTTLGGRPVADVAEEVAPLVPRDNPMTLRSRLPQFLVVTEVLDGLGIVDTSGAVEAGFDIRGAGEARRVEAVPADEFADLFGIWHPMIPPGLPPGGRAPYLQRASAEWWSGYLPRERAVYVQYNQTLGDSFRLGGRVARLVKQHSPRAVVLDLRHNPGGENAAAAGLHDALGRPAVRRVPLLVLVGRSTFSAAGILSLDLERDLDPVFVGEPTGFSTHFFGDPASETLEAAGITVNAAGVRWADAADGAFDEPLVPDVEEVVSARDFFAGADPVLEAALGTLRR